MKLTLKEQREETLREALRIVREDLSTVERHLNDALQSLRLLKKNGPLGNERNYKDCWEMYSQAYRNAIGEKTDLEQIELLLSSHIQKHYR